jgi:hypothetical protein
MKRLVVGLLIVGGVLNMEPLCAENWDFPLTVSTPDTSWEVKLGVRPAANAHYDLFFDVPYIGTPLDAAAFFTVYNGLFDMPIWLTSDRKKGDGIYLPWKLQVGIGAGAANRTVKWDTTSLPPGTWTISSTLPDTMVNMAETDSLSFSLLSTPKIVRAFRPINDPTGPVISASDPADGDTGVPINTSIRITLVDQESWVDDTTIILTVDERSVIASTYLVEKGYELWLELLVDLPADSNIVVQVRSKNVADTPVESIQSFSFRTSGETAIYSLSGIVSCADSASPEGAMVDISRNDTLIHSDTVDSSGEYHLSPLSSGLHTVTVNLASYREAFAYPLIFLEQQKRDFTLQPLTGISETRITTPRTLSVIACPNPSGRTTSIRFHIPTSSHVDLQVVDILGRHVATLYSGTTRLGSHQVSWRSNDYPGGMYFIRLKAGRTTATARVTLLR